MLDHIFYVQFVCWDCHSEQSISKEQMFNAGIRSWDDLPNGGLRCFMCDSKKLFPIGTDISDLDSSATGQMLNAIKREFGK